MSQHWQHSSINHISDAFPSCQENTSTPTGSASSPYGEHQGGQLQQAGQGSQGQGGGSRRARGGWAHQRWKETGQRQGQEEETAEKNIQEGAEGGARECLHLRQVLHLERKRDGELKSRMQRTPLDQRGVIHSGASCPGATSHGETGASSRAGARVLLFLLKHVAQGALAVSHRVLQQRTEETVGGSGTVTRVELGQDEKPLSTATSSPCSAPEDEFTLRGTKGGYGDKGTGEVDKLKHIQQKQVEREQHVQEDGHWAPQPVLPPRRGPVCGAEDRRRTDRPRPRLRPTVPPESGRTASPAPASSLRSEPPLEFLSFGAAVAQRQRTVLEQESFSPDWTERLHGDQRARETEEMIYGRRQDDKPDAERDVRKHLRDHRVKPSRLTFDPWKKRQSLKPDEVEASGAETTPCWVTRGNRLLSTLHRAPLWHKRT
ncbi:hypothetical protein EYF80_026721 [Liparis tanakae]|uniref:Uncharacterized protein n=1 Tax=Liparis tanakae TaxID=230148 RepID=A0A4Z2HCW1_9TELE|nr:hypothetical protein EYF80_026721 [Liparis tanakae]